MTITLEDRLTELEVRLAFVDDTMNVLNDTVSAHEQQLLEMRLAMDRLRSELVAMRGSLTSDARDEPPPPHY
ncbi:SlyX family protein [Dokdonella sp.]|uniref:SlyX family protein n=1 Tax=Dokdonella sp. TaxID=2291710 RepID=UPI001B160649|nr:SlyX family protein [Dokdonella sp.]MBO9662445.1 SlyX family protein [Dokdonella sp.]